MTAKRFFLVILFLGGVALGWFVRGENDGAVTETAVKHAVEVEKARSEKQIRDLEMGKANLQDKLAIASAKDAIIARLQKEIDELQAQLSALAKPAATPPTEPPKPEDPQPADHKP